VIESHPVETFATERKTEFLCTGPTDGSCNKRLFSCSSKCPIDVVNVRFVSDVTPVTALGRECYIYIYKIIRRYIDHMKFAAYMAASFITFIPYSSGSILYCCTYGCVFCVLLFNFLNCVFLLLCILTVTYSYCYVMYSYCYVMYSYYYVFLMLCYVFLLLCILNVMLCILIDMSCILIVMLCILIVIYSYCYVMYFYFYVFLLLCYVFLLLLLCIVIVIFMYSYCCVFLLLCYVFLLLLCILIFMYSYCYVYVFLLLCTFHSVYSVSLCRSVCCLCVNVYCTAATGCYSTAVNKYIYTYICVA